MSIENIEIGDVVRLKSNLGFVATVTEITGDGKSAICTYMDGNKPEQSTLPLAALTKKPVQRGIRNFDVIR